MVHTEMISGTQNNTTMQSPRRRKISVIRVHPLGIPVSVTTSSNTVATMPFNSSIIYEQQQNTCSTAPVQSTPQPPSFPAVTPSSSAGAISQTAPQTPVTGSPFSPDSQTIASNPCPLKSSKRVVSQSIADLPSMLSQIFKKGSSISSEAFKCKPLSSMKTLAKSCADLRQIDDASGATEEDENQASIQNSPMTTSSNLANKFVSPLDSPVGLSPSSTTANKFNFSAGKPGKSPLDMEIMERRIKHAMALQTQSQGSSKSSSSTSFTIHPHLPTYRASVLGSPPLARTKLSDLYRPEKISPGRRSRADSSISDSEDEGFPLTHSFLKYSSKSAINTPQRLSPTKLTRVTTPGLVDDPSRLLKAKLKHTHSLSVSNLPDSLMKESRSQKKGQTNPLVHGLPTNKEESTAKAQAKRPKDLPIHSTSSFTSDPHSVPLSKDHVYHTIHGCVNPMAPMSRSNLRRFEDCDRMDCAGDAELLDESYEDMLIEEGNSFEEGFYYPANHQYYQQQLSHGPYFYPFGSAGGSGGSSYNNTRRSGSPSSGYKTMGPYHFSNNYAATISSSSHNCDPVLVKYLKEREKQRQLQQHFNKFHSCAVRYA